MKVGRYVSISCAGLFIFLCFLHYLSFRPLWLDENFILANLKTLKLTGLFGPLQYSQEFPRVYLALIKALAENFNYNLLALRFLPLLSMIAGFFIWAKLYKNSFSRSSDQYLAIFSFCGSYYLTYYACELKPYSADLMLVGLFCLYLPWQKKVSRRLPMSFVVLTLALAFSLFFSYAAFFVFWIVAYNLILAGRKNYKFLFLAGGYLFLSAVFIYLIYCFDLRHAMANGSLFTYWNDYFISTDSLGSFFKNFGEGLRKLTVWWFGKDPFFRRAGSFFIPFFFFSLIGYGFKALKKDRFKIYNLESLGLIVFLELFLAGILRKYPFTGERITLFFAPFVFYFMIKGFSFFKRPRFSGFILKLYYGGFLAAGAISSFWIYLHFIN